MTPQTLITYMQSSPKFAAMVVELLEDSQNLALSLNHTTNRIACTAKVCGNALALGSMLELRERLESDNG